jgi:hypothetical protein
MNAFVSGDFTHVRSIRIHILTLTEAFAGGDITANELDDLENPVVVGYRSFVARDFVRPAIIGIDPEVDICR